MRSKRNTTLLAVFALTSIAQTSWGADAISSADREFFEKKIRPVLAEHCYKCHSGESKKLKAGLRVDGRALMLKGGDTGSAIEPGKPDKSLLIEAVSYKNVDMEMPPKGKLSDAAIADLTRWVEKGAPWPNDKGVTTKPDAGGFDIAKRKADHWSWQPVTDPSPPTVSNRSWPTSPIDNFILARLEARGYKPAVKADRRTLIRRTYFDIIGLPPTPAQVEAFVNDKSSNAFEKVVDELLASPHFGERWARHWMDLVRYAESRGHEFDYSAPNAHQYRDYLIRAFNSDVPYNQFVKEHIAGDLIAQPRMNAKDGFNESILATGFWWLGEWVHSPVDIRQDETDRFDNMVDVMSKSFLGLTVACARCHDHKFDAISQADYYSLQGFLQSSNYRQVRFESIEHNKKINDQLTKLRNESRPRIQRELATSMQPVLSRLADYLNASREALQEKPTTATTPKPARGGDVIFEDFEDGTYDGWTVTGTAFGDKPQTLQTIADYQGKINGVDTYFVNSHNIRSGGDVGKGDAHIGTMSSKPFKITHNYVTMLIGGGNHKDKTSINLMIGKRPAKSSVGPASNQMRQLVWDVRQFIGKTAYIKVIDNHRAGWGNIGFDHIVFTNKGNSKNKTRKQPQLVIDPLRIKTIASKHRLDENALAAWTKHLLNDANKNANDPMYAWARYATGAVKIVSDVNIELRPEQKLENIEVVWDLRDENAEFRQDGFNFKHVQPGDAHFSTDPARAITGIFDHAAARRDEIWKNLRIVDSENDAGKYGKWQRSGKTLRTPTFVLKHGVVRFLARGEADVYASVNSHRMINGPLHGRLISAIKSPGQYRWISHDLRRYIGHDLHIEFTPKSDDFSIAMVIEGDTSVIPLDRGNALLAQTLKVNRTNATLPTGYQRLFTGVAAALSADTIRKNKDIDAAKLANWMVQNPDLFAMTAGSQSKAFVDSQSKLVSQIKSDSRTAMAIMDGSAANEYLLIRGSHKNPGKELPRRFLEAIDGPDQKYDMPGSGRLQLANRITDPRNPYISRVIANRIWHHLFARGIVATVDDFGKLGIEPTHPQLLDHLATRFVRDGWSIKKSIKSIVMSSTYQMSSKPHDAKAEEMDPGNLLLHRARIRRLQSEPIRDSILAISGRLDRKLYGKPVGVYLTSFMEGRGRPRSGPLDGSGRRSIYINLRRNFLPPMMLAFDMPVPFNAIGRRSVSNVPAQALIMMNDPFVIQQAEVWAKRVLSDGKLTTTAKRINQLCQMAYARPATQQETVQFAKFIEQQAAAHGATATDQRPWADLCHVIMNTKEFIFIN